MAASECTTRSGVVTTYAHFSSFVFLVGCNTTAAVLEAVAVYLEVTSGLAAAFASADAPINDDEENTVATHMEKEQGIGAAGIMLVVLDVVVMALLYSGMAAMFASAADCGVQIGACASFARQVQQTKFLSLAACAAATLMVIVKGVK
jgi:hypothetical protein